MPLLPMPASVKAQMQRIVAARREVAIDSDQFLHAGYLAREHDAVARQAEFFRAFGRIQRRTDQRLAHHMRRVPGLVAQVVLVHQLRRPSLWSSEPQFTPMRTGLCVLQCEFDDGGELGVALLPKPTLPGLMRYFASASAQAGSRSSN